LEDLKKAEAMYLEMKVPSRNYRLIRTQAALRRLDPAPGVS
jgi:hypothetical protein